MAPQDSVTLNYLRSGTTVHTARIRPTERITSGCFELSVVGIEVTVSRETVGTPFPVLHTMRCIGTNEPSISISQIVIDRHTHWEARTYDVNSVISSANFILRLQDLVGLNIKINRNNECLRSNRNLQTPIIGKLGNVEPSLFESCLGHVSRSCKFIRPCTTRHINVKE